MLDALGVARYKTIRLIGSGGMGELYEVWDERLERRVAVKRLHPHVIARPDGEQLVLHEARSAAKIEHPNVVRVYGVERSGKELLIEMQFIEGRSLSALLQGMPLPLDLAADLLRQILEGLAACHAQGVIHRDLKPANVLVDAAGNVFLTDFGVAQVLRAGVPDNSVVSAWGTPRFTPPEAWAGGSPTPLWDLYAAGIILREALTGATPFDGETVADVRDQVAGGVHGSILEIRPEISPAFAKLIDDLTAKDPSDRPENARAALRQLQATPEYALAREYARGSSRRHGTVSAVPPRTHGSMGETIAVEPPAKSWPRVVAVLVVLAAILGLGMLLWFPWNTPPVQETLPDEQPDGATPSVAPASPPTAPEVNEPRLLAAHGRAFYFAYDDGVHGEELWGVVDNEVPVLMTDIAPGPASSSPRNFHAIDDRHYFFLAATPEHGEELWVNYDSGKGQFVKPSLVIDAMPGRMGSSPEPVYSCGTMLYFLATTREYGRELWSTLGSAPQSALVADLRSGELDSPLSGPRVFAVDDGFYWVVRCDESGGDSSLYFLDCEKHTLERIGSASYSATCAARIDDRFYLPGVDAEHGNEIWAHDRTTGAYGLAVDVNPGSQSSSPSFMFSFKDFFFFRANSAELGAELFRSDGTPGGTRMVKDINAGIVGSDPYGFIDMGDYALFRAKTDEHGVELWYTDGTEAGTGLVADINPGPASAEPYNLARLGSKLFFSALHPEYGEELWVTERVGETFNTRLVVDLRPGVVSSFPYGLGFNDEGVGMFTAEISETEGWLHRLSVEGDTIDVRLMPRIDPNNVRTPV